MPCTALGEVRHNHDVHHQARPAGEMLRALPSTCLRVVLFPCKASLLPLPEHVFYHIRSQLDVDIARLLLVRSFSRGYVLLEESVHFQNESAGFSYHMPTNSSQSDSSC